MSWGSVLEDEGHALAELAATQPMAALRGTLKLLENDWVLDYEGYNDWLLTAGECLERLEQPAAAALTWLGRDDIAGTLERLPVHEAPRERAAVLERAGHIDEAAKLCGRMGCWARAAVVYEDANQIDRAIAAWEDAVAAYPEDVDRMGHVYANLGLAQLLYHRDAAAAKEPLNQGLIGLASLAVDAEINGQLDRAQARYRALATIGMHTRRIEDVLEGAVNLARLLLEAGDVRGALEVRVGAAKACGTLGAQQAAATLWHEAQVLARRSQPSTAKALGFLSAQAWEHAADHILASNLLATLAENALLARIDVLNALGDEAAIGDTFARLSELDLKDEAKQRYAALARTMTGAQPAMTPDMQWLQRFRLVGHRDRWCDELLEREYGEGLRDALLLLTVKAESILGRRRALRGLMRTFLSEEERVDSTIGAIILLAGAIDQPIPRRALLGLAGDPSAAVRKVVMAALGPMERREVTHVLVEAIRDPDEDVAAKAIEGLMEWPRREAVPLLMRLAREGSLKEARKAISLMEATGDDPAALDALFELSQSDTPLAELAATSFERSCPSHLEAVYALRRESERAAT